MNKKQIEQFKKLIYEPYNEAWGIMKAMRDKEPKDDAFWKEFVKTVDHFPEKYGNSEFSQSLQRVMYDAGSVVGRITNEV